jgi:nucleoside-diphosphate-sugar epimerase
MAGMESTSRKKEVVLIAGCGYVGNELARQLLENGKYSVYGLRRTISKLPEGVEPIEGDLFDQNNLGTWPAQIDYVVYCAGADSFDDEKYKIVYVQGLTNVLNHLSKDGYKPRRVLFTSTTSVYHQNEGDTVDETSPTVPNMFNGKRVLEGEQLVLRSKFPGSVVRFGGIYGPNRFGLIDRVKMKKGCPSEPVRYTNFIHRDDSAGILAHLINQDAEGSLVHSVYIGVDHLPFPIHDSLHWIADKLNVVLDDGNPSFIRSKRCLNQRIISTGYMFKYPDFKAGYLHEINRHLALKDSI